MLWIVYEPWFYFIATLGILLVFNFGVFGGAQKDLRKTKQFRINRLYEEYEHKAEKPTDPEEYLNFRRHALELQRHALALKAGKTGVKGRNSAGRGKPVTMAGQLGLKLPNSAPQRS